MRLKELYIENFGKLSAYRVSFDPGLNSYCLENGAGKTTLTVFIKAMLYGLNVTHKQQISENDRKKYAPWQGGAYGGWLSFEVGDKRYRIERTFGQKASDDTFALYDLDLGSPSEDYSADIGMELFGIDADGFERTVFLSEKNLAGKNENQSISAKLSDLVGVEGDIGGFDAAITLLDNRRKFYQKRGGAGEIQELRTEMASTEDAIAEIDRKTLRLDEAEAEYAALSDRARAARGKKERLLSANREAARQRAQQSLVTQYTSMLASLAEDEKREGTLLAFFARKIPTSTEIREVAELLSEAERLERTAEAESSPELDTLRDLFKTQTSYNECSEMVRIAEELSLGTATEESDKKPPVCPFARIPTESEIAAASERAATKNPTKSRHGTGVALIIAGICTALLGALLISVSPYLLYALAPLGALVAVFGIVLSLSAKQPRDSDARDFIRSVYGEARDSESALSVLIEMRAALERYRAQEEEFRRESAVSLERREQQRAKSTKLDEFLAKFDTPPASPLEKARLIASKHQRYLLLCEQETKRKETRRQAIEASRERRKAASEFLSLFPTETDKPLDEIRSAFSEYEVLNASLTGRRREAERFALANGIGAADIAERSAPVDVAEEQADMNNVDSELIEIERALSASKSTMDVLSREVEMRPVLEERLLELREKLLQYEANLSAITKAKELLAEAKKNMTARYLDGTCRGFRRYVSLIDGTEDEYSMDTSFTVMRTDHGASRVTDSYSRGTRDLYALAVRLALSDALYEGELPPIILDDPFTSLDDERTERALATVKKLASERQILYFTCAKSRKIK